MTELYDMPVREEETPICWDVVEFAMSQLKDYDVFSVKNMQ